VKFSPKVVHVAEILDLVAVLLCMRETGIPNRVVGAAAMYDALTLVLEVFTTVIQKDRLSSRI
jgi:hypothetical protein